jgi:hypothetical protein
MSDASQMDFLIDFNLEVLYGCRNKCYGCNVQRFDQEGFVGDDFNRLMVLFADLKANNHILSNLGIGPTDFMSSENAEQIFVPELKPMIDMFCAVTLQSSFLYKKEHLDKWVAILRPLLKGKKLKFLFPIDPRHSTNAPYLDQILDNVNYMVSQLPDVSYTKTYVVCNLKQYADLELDPVHNLDTLSRVVREHHIDILVTEGRLPQNDLNNRMKLKHAINYLNSFYEDPTLSDSVRQAITLDNYFKPYEGTDKDYVYKMGRIYAPAFVGEPLVVFDEMFAVPANAEWTTSSLIDFENSVIVNQLGYLDSTKECATCEFVNLCISRSLVQTMCMLKSKDCIAPKRALEKARGNTIL